MTRLAHEILTAIQRDEVDPMDPFCPALDLIEDLGGVAVDDDGNTVPLDLCDENKRTQPFHIGTPKGAAASITEDHVRWDERRRHAPSGLIRVQACDGYAADITLPVAITTPLDLGN
ncbi:MAG: hypothetical protein ABIH21_02425 [Patescibacteria group bacterium]